MQANSTTDTVSATDVPVGGQPIDVIDIIDDLELARERATWIQTLSDAVIDSHTLKRNPDRARILGSMIQYFAYELADDLKRSTARANQYTPEALRAMGATQ